MQKEIYILPLVLGVILQVITAEKPVRLSGGTSPYEGRVEIFNDGEWGTVCDTGWGMKEAEVVCDQLGFALATRADISLEFGPGNGTIWMDDVDCNGNEDSLDKCDADWGKEVDDDCSHYDDAGVICSPIREGAIRVFGGDNRFQGGVEIYIGGEWGTICDHGWSGNDVKVSCRQLGYPQAKHVYLDARRYFGAIRYGYIIEDIGCDGYESEILDCWPIDYTPEFCDPYDLAGLECYESLQNSSGMSASAIAGIVIASIFGLMLCCCCCAAACSSSNRKRSSPTRRARNPNTQQGNVNVVYNTESDSPGFSYPSPPAPLGPGINTMPFTPPAGYMPGYVPPMTMPTDAPPAYEPLDYKNQLNTGSLGQPSVDIATTNPYPPTGPIATTNPYPPTGPIATTNPYPPTGPIATTNSYPPTGPIATTNPYPPTGPIATTNPYPPTGPIATTNPYPPTGPIATTNPYPPTGSIATTNPYPPTGSIATTNPYPPTVPISTTNQSEPNTIYDTIQ